MSTPRKPPISRSAARLGAVAQFSSRAAGDNFDNGECGEADYKHLRDVVEGAVREQALLDPALDRILDKDWPLHRLDSTVRAILRAGAYELAFMEKVPARVVISEYVDVADAFFDGGDEPRFINGVLNTLARQRRPEEFAA
jgi:transcription antitermination protein NusB